MSSSIIQYSDRRDLPRDDLIALYRANEWSSAEKPELLHKALAASHSLFSAWDGSKLVGVGNAISDGFLVVYYPHLIVLPDYQGQGIGTELMRRLERFKKYCSHTVRWCERAIFLGFGVVSAPSQVNLNLLRRRSLAKTPKILAPCGYTIF